MHTWNDSFDFKKLSVIERYIKNRVWWLSFCHLSTKEKYGTIIYQRIFPPYCRIWARNRLQWHWIASKFCRKWESFGWYVTWFVIQRAIKKWPEMTDEILSDFAYNESLVGYKIHRQYWE